MIFLNIAENNQDIPITKSIIRTLRYLDDFISSDKFQADIKTLRETIGVPESGMEVNDYFLSEDIDSWVFKLPKGINSTDKDINLFLKEIAEPLVFRSLEISIALRAYLLFGKLSPFIENLLLESLATKNLCQIIDLREEFLWRNQANDALTKYIDELTSKYPTAILINPEASKRDLIEYINKYWSLIDEYRLKYIESPKKIGNTRKINPKIRARNELIWSNKDKSIKEIVRILASNGFEVMDEGLVGKILSLFRKNRS